MVKPVAAQKYEHTNKAHVWLCADWQIIYHANRIWCQTRYNQRQNLIKQYTESNYFFWGGGGAVVLLSLHSQAELMIFWFSENMNANRKAFPVISWLVLG